MKSTLFLDIDGVIATPKQYSLGRKNKSWIHKYDVYPFDEKCVKILNEILSLYEMDIVIHSDWQYHFNLNELQDIFEINGVIQGPVAISGGHYAMDPWRDRVLRVENYIKDNGVSNFLCLDDVDISTRVIEKGFFKTVEREGLKQSGLKEKILKFCDNSFVVSK